MREVTNYFILFFKTAEGSALYQIQNGTPKLIGNASKRIPPAAMNYLITEIELLGLCVNINQFKHLLAKVDLIVQ